jgi:hypothetical protein
MFSLYKDILYKNILYKDILGILGILDNKKYE